MPAGHDISNITENSVGLCCPRSPVFNSFLIETLKMYMGGVGLVGSQDTALRRYLSLLGSHSLCRLRALPCETPGHSVPEPEPAPGGREASPSFPCMPTQEYLVPFWPRVWKFPHYPKVKCSYKTLGKPKWCAVKKQFH